MTDKPYPASFIGPVGPLHHEPRLIDRDEVWNLFKAMTDIIERLRQSTDPVRHEAAAEIERLRAFIQGCSTCKEEWERIEARAALEHKP